MVDADYFGHASRIAVSSPFGRAGETLEMHSGWKPEPGVAISGWMNSSTHRAVLLSSQYRYVGMGIAAGATANGPYTVWVAHVEGAALGRELAAELGERALLGLVEGAERLRDAVGVLGEEALDQLTAAVGEVDDHEAPVVRVAPAPNEAALLERGGDLGGVGLGPAQPAASVLAARPSRRRS